MKTLFTIAFVILLTIGSNGQQMLSFKKGRINTTSGKQIKISNLQQEENQFLYTDIVSRERTSININEVLRIEQKVGDNALLYCAGMGISGFLGAILGSVASPYYKENKDQMWDIVLPITGISAVAGLIWGASVPKYKTVYRNNKNAVIFNNKLNISVSLSEVKQIYLTYSF